jgi:hypothetical protein
VRVGWGGGRPADSHLRTEHLLQAGVHFVLLNKFTPVSLGNALVDGHTETGILLKQAQRGILD